MTTKLLVTSLVLSAFGWSCPSKPAPAPSPRPTPTEITPAPTNTATPTRSPSPTPMYKPTLATTCSQPPSQFVGEFRNGMKRYMDKHPEQFDGSYFRYPLSQDVFFYGIGEEIEGHGLDLVIDPCLCGDVQVSAHGTPLGMGFQEGYHPLSSSRYVQAAPYKGSCEPKWVEYQSTGEGRVGHE